jgi:hypothetical protein
MSISSAPAAQVVGTEGSLETLNPAAALGSAASAKEASTSDRPGQTSRRPREERIRIVLEGLRGEMAVAESRWRLGGCRENSAGRRGSGFVALRQSFALQRLCRRLAAPSGQIGPFLCWSRFSRPEADRDGPCEADYESGGWWFKSTRAPRTR